MTRSRHCEVVVSMMEKPRVAVFQCRIVLCVGRRSPPRTWPLLGVISFLVAQNLNTGRLWYCDFISLRYLWIIILFKVTFKKILGFQPRCALNMSNTVYCSISGRWCNSLFRITNWNACSYVLVLWETGFRKVSWPAVCQEPKRSVNVPTAVVSAIFCAAKRAVQELHCTEQCVQFLYHHTLLEPQNSLWLSITGKFIFLRRVQSFNRSQRTTV